LASPEAETATVDRDAGYERGAAERPIGVLLVVSALAGIAIGALATAFRLLADHALELQRQVGALLQDVSVLAWLVPMLIAGGMVAASLEIVRRLAPEASGSGVQEIEGALAGLRPLRWWRVIPAKFAAGLLSLGSGLLLGREGPTIQIGGNVAQMVARGFRLSRDDAHALVAAGAAAGLAAAFNAPLSGILFVLEEMRRHFRYGFRSFQCVLVCAALSDATVRLLTSQQPVIVMPIFDPAPLSSIWVFPLFGVLLGALGVGFNRGLVWSLDFFSGLRGLAFSLRGLWLGGAVGLLGWWSVDGVGGGYTVIGDALAMRLSLGAVFMLFAIRFAATVLSYGSGAAGGIFAPMLALGTLLGMGLGQALQASVPGVPEPGVLALAGMAGLFSATVRAPVTGIALAVEMTGNFGQILPIYSLLLDRSLLRDGHAPTLNPSGPPQTLDYVVLIVSDLDRSLDFYTGVIGLGIRQRAESYAQLESGGTRLGLFTRDAMAETLGSAIDPASNSAPAFELGFKVADVDARYADLVARGATPVAEPRDRPWSQRTAYVRDPDGHLVELVEDASGGE
jgi:CIC family chloride channel protein